MSYVYIPIQNIFAKVVKSDKIAIDFLNSCNLVYDNF